MKKPMKFRKLLLLLGGIFLLVLIGCTAHPVPPLRIATNVWTGYESLYLARTLNYFDTSSIRLVEMGSASRVSNALRNNMVEAAALTLDETLGLLQDRVPLRIILVMDISNGADAMVSKPSMHSLEDLRGKRIGVEEGATGAVMLDAALERAHLQASDLRLVSIPVNEHMHAWETNEIDAVVTFDPVRSQLLAKGGNILFNSSQVPGRIVDVLVVREDAIAQHADQIKTLLQAHFKALQYFKLHPRETAIAVAAHLGVTPAQVPEAFNGIKLPDCVENQQALTGAPSTIESTATSLAQLMLRHKLLAKEVSVAHIALPDFIPGCY
jgi:NitT/TauT family transport system substrate-binding protein